MSVFGGLWYIVPVSRVLWYIMEDYEGICGNLLNFAKICQIVGVGVGM